MPTTADPAITVVDAPASTRLRPVVVGDRVPIGLWLMLGAITTLLINVSVVLYLASQMPR